MVSRIRTRDGLSMKMTRGICYWTTSWTKFTLEVDFLSSLNFHIANCLVSSSRMGFRQHHGNLHLEYRVAWTANSDRSLQLSRQSNWSQSLYCCTSYPDNCSDTWTLIFSSSRMASHTNPITEAASVSLILVVLLKILRVPCSKR